MEKEVAKKVSWTQFYYFDYFYKYEELTSLINYLEKNYKLNYKEIIDLPSIFSLNIFGLGIGFNKKKVLFIDKTDMRKVHTCDNCNFPIEDVDLKLFGGTTDRVCRNCNIKPKLIT